MRSGVCVKCGTRDVRVAEARPEVALRLGGIRDSPLTYYVCAACGYAEMYLEDPKGMEKLRKGAVRAAPAGEPAPPWGQGLGG